MVSEDVDIEKYDVFFLFHGFDGEYDIAPVQSRLTDLGWKVQDAQNTHLAASHLEIRYSGSEPDRKAAELLAEDMMLSGWASNAPIISQVANVLPDQLEIWAGREQ